MRGLARRAVAVAALLVAASAAPAAAQNALPPGDELHVYLMTMGPGDAVWERFGHNAIRIQNVATGEDRVYNWGMFAIDDMGFILRFLRGRMRYWMASEDAILTVEAYRQHNRSVTVQVLNLTAAQKLALYAFVRNNERPENRFYDYDYFRDNCSTRVRDALDVALGGALARQFSGARTDMTYRDHARRLMQPDPWTYTGIDIGLGRPTDQPVTAWEEMFIPMSLQRLIRDMKVPDAAGMMQPLVADEIVLVQAQRPEPPQRPDARFPVYLLIGMVVGGVIVAAALTRALPLATGLSVAWCLTAGVLGLALVFLWTATEHVTSYQNANVLALNPAWLVLAWLVIARSRAARGLALVLVAAAAASVVLLPFPGQQDTTRVLALVLPIHMAVLIAVTRRVPVA